MGYKLIYLLSIILASIAADNALATNLRINDNQPLVLAVTARFHCPPNLPYNLNNCKRCPPGQQRDVTGTHCMIKR